MFGWSSTTTRRLKRNSEFSSPRLGAAPGPYYTNPLKWSPRSSVFYFNVQIIEFMLLPVSFGRPRDRLDSLSIPTDEALAELGLKHYKAERAATKKKPKQFKPREVSSEAPQPAEADGAKLPSTDVVAAAPRPLGGTGADGSAGHRSVSNAHVLRNRRFVLSQVVRVFSFAHTQACSKKCLD